jgi:hypothetical protein
VTNELSRSGQLARVGGAVYLETLLSTVPTAANAGYFTQIVGERAVVRRLVTAGTRIVQMGYDTASGASRIVGSVDPWPWISRGRTPLTDGGPLLGDGQTRIDDAAFSAEASLPQRYVRSHGISGLAAHGAPTFGNPVYRIATPSYAYRAGRPAGEVEGTGAPNN